jgi:hypothetical protein
MTATPWLIVFGFINLVLTASFKGRGRSQTYRYDLRDSYHGSAIESGDEGLRRLEQIRCGWSHATDRKELEDASLRQVSAQALPYHNDRRFCRPRRIGPGHPIAFQLGHAADVRPDPIRET